MGMATIGLHFGSSSPEARPYHGTKIHQQNQGSFTSDAMRCVDVRHGAVLVRMNALKKRQARAANYWRYAYVMQAAAL